MKFGRTTSTMTSIASPHCHSQIFFFGLMGQKSVTLYNLTGSKRSLGYF